MKKTTFTFKLYEDQGDAVEMILKLASRQTGITDLNQLFEHICSEWAGDHIAEAAEKAKAVADKKRKALVKSGAALPKDHPMAKPVAAPAAAA
jgi:hypothetical protein